MTGTILDGVAPVLKVYWADQTSSTGETGKITAVPPVTTIPVEKRQGNYVVIIKLAALQNPPGNAYRLLAVLDADHVLNDETSEDDNALTTGPLNGRLSFELEGPPFSPTIAPDAPTRYARVQSWLKEHATMIIRAEKVFHVDRLAIAGEIAWEALQNVLPVWIPTSVRGRGPGKVHFRDSVLYEGNPDSKMVEGTDRYGKFRTPMRGFILPHRTVQARGRQLGYPKIAITYVAAINNAYSVLVKAYIGANIRNSPGILATYYEGTNYHLATASKDFASRPSGPLLPNDKMGQWVANNMDYLQQAIGQGPIFFL